MDRFRIISLVIALLVAQFSYAGHYHAVDEHHAETECFLCIHVSSLDHALPSGHLITPHCLLQDSPAVANHQVIQLSQNKLFDSRAPPLFS